MDNRHDQEELLVIPYRDRYQVDWDELVAQAANSSLLHFRRYMDYHSHRFLDASTMVIMGDELHAVFPAESIQGQVYSHRGLTFAGPLFHRELDPWRYTEVVQCLIDYYRLQGFKQLTIRPVPQFYWNTSGYSELSAVFSETGFREVETQEYDTAPLPTDQVDTVRLWGRRKAERLGLVMRQEHSFKEFWEEVLVPHIESRLGAKPVHTLEEIETLAAAFPNSIQLWTVREGNRLLAGTLLFLHGTVVHCQYIASNPEGRAARALDLLFCGLIDQMKDRFSHLSLGTSVDPATGSRHPGIVKWKQSWGAVPVSTASWFRPLS